MLEFYNVGVIMRKAFTLIELLVVMSIVAVLIGLALPAIQRVRESARAAQCISNQKNLAIALQSYETSNKRLPGWRDLITSSLQGPNGEEIAAQVSWVFCILPHIEATDLYSLLKTGQIEGSIPSIAILNCPSYTHGPAGRATSYVGNGGAVDNFFSQNIVTADRKVANGPFLDRARIIAGEGDFTSGPRRFEDVARLEDIAKMDGTAYTLLVSENVQRGFWIADEIIHFYHSPDGSQRIDIDYRPVSPSDNRLTVELTGVEDTIEGSVTFCWPRSYYNNTPNNSICYLLDTRNLNNESPGFLRVCLCGQSVCPRGTFVIDDENGIPARPNSDRIPCYLNMFRQKTTFPSWYNSARPSSYHPGLVIAAFCDGSTRPLSEIINERLFVQLMAAGDAQSDAGRRIPEAKNFLEGRLLEPSAL